MTVDERGGAIGRATRDVPAPILIRDTSAGGPGPTVPVARVRCHGKLPGRMVGLREVMVVSESFSFSDDVAQAIEGAGALAICVQTLDGVAQAIDEGFRPEALVIDGTVAWGPAVVAMLEEAPECEAVRVVAAAPCSSFDGQKDATVVKRHDMDAVLRLLEL